MPQTTSYERWEGLGAELAKIGNQSSDPESSTEQASCKYGDQSSDPSEVVMHKDQCSRQPQLKGSG